MTIFIIASIVLFLLSLISNIVYVLNIDSPSRMGAVFGIIAFSIMISWGAFLLI
mgnify:CR=1 FL=1|tara:strand:- start:470 stop:631 length:162 start_codon:yes stop_codon:yes gene_type:complete